MPECDWSVAGRTAIAPTATADLRKGDAGTKRARLAPRWRLAIARVAGPLRESRATLHGGSERLQAMGEAGLMPASFLLDPASLQPIRVVSGGGGI
jgi:hypothetical protein